MKPAHFGQLFGVILSAAIFASALSGAVWLVQFSQSDGLARYPQARRLAETRFAVDTRGEGQLSQSSLYQTPDNADRVLSWYALQHRLEQGGAPGDAGACRTFTRLERWVVFRYGIVVTLCAQPRGTLIFVNRSLVLR